MIRNYVVLVVQSTGQTIGYDYRTIHPLYVYHSSATRGGKLH